MTKSQTWSQPASNSRAASSTATGGWGCALNSRDLLLQPHLNAGVRHRFQKSLVVRVTGGKHDLRYGRAVDLAGAIQDTSTPPLDQRLDDIRFAQHFVAGLVGIEYLRAQLAELVRHQAFAARDAADEAEYEHGCR